MLILLIIVFLLIVSATLFLICRKRKKGKIVYAISMGIFLFLFLRYQRESGVLKNFSDYKEAYYENYNGEIRFVLNGDKTDLIVGVNENGVQNYVMVYKSKNGKLRTVLDERTKRIFPNVNGVIMEEESSIFLDDHYLIISYMGEECFEIECQDISKSLEINQPFAKGIVYYVYAKPDENGMYTIILDGEEVKFKL